VTWPVTPATAWSTRGLGIHTEKQSATFKQQQCDARPKNIQKQKPIMERDKNRGIFYIYIYLVWSKWQNTWMRKKDTLDMRKKSLYKLGKLVTLIEHL